MNIAQRCKQLILAEFDNALAGTLDSHWRDAFSKVNEDALIGASSTVRLAGKLKTCVPAASPVVLVRKADGSLRLCIDYRKPNSKTQRDAFPLPLIDESLDALCKAQVFSTIGLANSYHQVAVHEKDWHKSMNGCRLVSAMHRQHSRDSCRL